jgi:hypothetical protein
VVARDEKETHSDRKGQYFLSGTARSCQELPPYLANGRTVMDSQIERERRLVAERDRKETHPDRKGNFLCL